MGLVIEIATAGRMTVEHAELDLHVLIALRSPVLVKGYWRPSRNTEWFRLYAVVVASCEFFEIARPE